MTDLAPWPAKPPKSSSTVPDLVVVPGTADAPWHLFRRVALLFVATHCVLFVLPFPLSLLMAIDYQPVQEALGSVLGPVFATWNEWTVAATNWIGSTVFGLDEPIRRMQSGSGDTLFNWVRAATIALAAAAVSLLGLVRWPAWSCRGAWRCLHWLLRFYLASMMLSYALAKIVPSQFGPPDPTQLLKPYGEATPMNLAWTYFGFSDAYQMFTGWSEGLGALLLLWRRTVLLGALVMFAVLVNVVMVNLCFDVPVKLNSLHYLGMTLLLLLPETRRLFGFFVGNRAVAPADHGEPTAAWSRWTLRILSLLMVAGIGWNHYQGFRRNRAARPPAAAPVPLAGVYDVVEFSMEQPPVPAAPAAGTEPPTGTQPATVAPAPAPTAAPTAPPRWQRVAFGTFGRCRVQFADGSSEPFGASWKDAEKQIELRGRTPRPTPPPAGQAPSSPPAPPPPLATLTLDTTDPAAPVLRGTFRDATVTVKLRLADTATLPLLNTPFRWIQEFPQNR